jgi:hypothetical protein
MAPDRNGTIAGVLLRFAINLPFTLHTSRGTPAVHADAIPGRRTCLAFPANLSQSQVSPDGGRVSVCMAMWDD